MFHPVSYTFPPFPQAVPIIVVPMQAESTTSQAAPVHVFAVPTQGEFIIPAAPTQVHLMNVTICNGRCAQREFYQASAPAPAALPAPLCENCQSSTKRLSSNSSSSSARSTISYGQGSNDYSSSRSSHRSQRGDADAHEHRREQKYAYSSSDSGSQSDGWPETDGSVSRSSDSFSRIYRRDPEHYYGGSHGHC